MIPNRSALGRHFRLSCVLLSAIASVVLLAGCGGGGGGGGSDTGSAQLVVTWPSRSRLIPVAANAIKATFMQGQTEVASQILQRPTNATQTTTTFNNLKVGTLSLVATAYPNADGSGTPQATGTTPVTITSGQTTSVQLTMSSTVSQIALSPSTNPSVAVGANLPFTVTAKNAGGAVVLISPSTLQWSSGNTALATVDTNGVAKGVAPTGASPGQVQISVTESESGKSASAQLKVTSSTTVDISPATPTISVGDPKAFTATVTNAPDTSVTWSVQEGSAGGSITTAGAYTAPASPGTYHVVATSKYDNSKQATMAVTVQAGNANVVIK